MVRIGQVAKGPGKLQREGLAVGMEERTGIAVGAVSGQSRASGGRKGSWFVLTVGEVMGLGLVRSSTLREGELRGDLAGFRGGVLCERMAGTGCWDPLPCLPSHHLHLTPSSSMMRFD